MSTASLKDLLTNMDWDGPFYPAYSLKHAIGEITAPGRKNCSHERQRFIGGRWECKDCYGVIK